MILGMNPSDFACLVVAGIAELDVLAFVMYMCSRHDDDDHKTDYKP